MRGRRKSASRNSHNSRQKNTCCRTRIRALLTCVIMSLVMMITVFLVITFISCYHDDSFGSQTLHSDWTKRMRIAINLSKSSTIITSLNSKAIISSDGDQDPSGIFSSTSERYYAPVPLALIEARKVLDNHPLNKLISNRSLESYSLEDAMFYLYSQPQCKNKPIFTSMAQVGSDLYWQLIENFIYTMVKFNLIDCSIMICVTDQNCMNLCKKSGFPCYYYDHLLHNPGTILPSALEQIANLKLLHLPKALKQGVRYNLL